MPPPLWLPPNCFNLQLTLESTPKLTRFVQPPPLSPCRGPTPCDSAHLQPDAPWVEGQHGARPQVDGHHAEGPLRQGAPRDQGPRRTLALGINLARTRMKMLTTVTAMKALPHTQLDNQQTAFDSVRLKKGAPVGQMTRNFYTQELGVLKNSKNFVRNTQAQHLNEVMCGVYRSGGSGYGGPASDEKFFDPEKVKNYTSAMRFKNPERVLPDIRAEPVD